MKKLLLASFALTLFSTITRAQEPIHDANVEKRTVGSFHGIEISTGIDLVLNQGGTEEVAVSAAKTEHRDKIVTKVENGILKIHYKSEMGSINRIKESKNLRAYVSCKTLDLLEVNTGANVKINGVLNSSSLSLKANTGGLVKGEVNIASLTVSLNTGSKITLTGKAGKLSVDGDTGSKFMGDEMATSDCSVTVSTGAVVTVRAEKELQVKANTGGKVNYKGGASIREIKTSTGGSVNKI